MNGAPSSVATVCPTRVAADAGDPPPAPAALGPLGSWLLEHGCGRRELMLLVAVEVSVLAFALLLGLALRFQDPALFAWGQHLLHFQRGLLMTALLPVGGLALFAALRFATVGRIRSQRLALVVATLAGTAFLVFAAIDIEHKIHRRLLPGDAFRPNVRYVAYRFGVRLPRGWKPHAEATPAVASEPQPIIPAERRIDAANGRSLFMRVCASCHGPSGQGLPGSGLSLPTSEFVAAKSDEELVGFLKVGRQPWDPDSKTRVQMPPRGGDPRVTDDDLRDVVAYVRELHERAAAPAQPPVASAQAAQQPGASDVNAGLPPAAADEASYSIVDRSYIPEAPPGPAGLAPSFFAALARPAWAIPERAGSYFGMLYAVTGITVLHVIVALIGVGLVLWAASRRRSPLGAHPLLVLATAGWWWATTCWLLAFGLLYT